MQLGEKWLDTVAFLCIEGRIAAGVAMKPVATVFFVTDHEASDPRPVWAVTARHCIEEATRANAPVAVRVNAGDSYIDVPTQVEDWFLADDSDVACCFWASTEGDVVAVPLLQLVREDFTYPFGHLMPERHRGGVEIEGGDVGWRPEPVTIGADVAFVGLFSQHAGSDRNLPVARFGNVSRLPREQVTVPRPWGKVKLDAYLVEARSWGGHSGSPAVWIHPYYKIEPVAQVARPLNRVEQRKGIKPRTQQVWATHPEPMFAVLGLVSGHFDIDRPATDKEVRVGDVPVNSGIAVVTPAHHIAALINRDDVREQADQYRAEWDPAAPATMDVLEIVEDTGVSEGSEDNPEFENFDNLARELVNTPKPGAGGGS